MRMLRLHDVLVDRLASAVRVRHRGRSRRRCRVDHTVAGGEAEGGLDGSAPGGVARLRGRLGGRPFRQVLSRAPDPVGGRWEGRPLVLEPWQRRMMGEALAYDADGWPVWRSVVIVAAAQEREDGCCSRPRPLPAADVRAPGDPARGALRQAGGPAVRRRRPVRAPLAGALAAAAGARPRRRDRARGRHAGSSTGSRPTRRGCTATTRRIVVVRRAGAVDDAEPAPRLRGADVGRWCPSAPQVFTITTAGEAA